MASIAHFVITNEYAVAVTINPIDDNRDQECTINNNGSTLAGTYRRGYVETWEGGYGRRWIIKSPLLEVPAVQEPSKPPAPQGPKPPALTAAPSPLNRPLSPQDVLINIGERIAHNICPSSTKVNITNMGEVMNGAFDVSLKNNEVLSVESEMTKRVWIPDAPKPVNSHLHKTGRVCLIIRVTLFVLTITHM